MNRLHSPKIFLVAALGALAMLALPGLAAAKDRNNDRIPDRWEKRHRLSLTVQQTHRDQDRDHLRNRAEFLAGDNPRDADSDNDGVTDGEENAGTIQSFDPATGRLVINLFGGETIAGLVTDQTEIECEESAPSAMASHDAGEADGEEGDEGDQSEEDDHSGPDSPNSGPDHDGDNGNCTTADLIEGTVVEEAELELANGAATFEEIELAD